MSASEDAKIRAIADDWAAAAREDFMDGYTRENGRCESPIERVLFAALWCIVMRERDEPEQPWGFPDQPYEPASEKRDGKWLYPQAKVLKYRVDFLIEVWWKKQVQLIVIECDGHDFHERTKEQAAHDKSRDREMTLAGFKVLRFTGAEIWADAITCADQIDEATYELYITVNQQEREAAARRLRDE